MGDLYSTNEELFRSPDRNVIIEATTGPRQGSGRSLSPIAAFAVVAGIWASWSPWAETRDGVGIQPAPFHVKT
ncbi:hypothetical protein [Methylobacterium nonmethylotrophicum]|uniref:Uncharacterized protein n=1 Tax=Methylobacterium nonmethylotrophicum TaxID=1141884 RepID=A0A4Z0NRF8_9HYPH|nr:hypothetical protein [Methylobacterium nonmethylotrophicum]TGD99732.1 hypothetical protein EU555_11200 [Methylobacterium nonmethylotrophicum]